MWKFAVKAILRNRILILVTIAILTIFMGFMATRVQMQYENASILPESDSTSIVYNDFIRKFGQDGTVMFVGIVDRNLFLLPHFYALFSLTDSLR